jgi:hypothetical protein
VAVRAPDPDDDRVRGRRGRPVDALRPLPDREPRRPRRARAAVPRHPAVPGEPALAVAQHDRRRDAYPGDALRRPDRVGEPRSR